MTRDHHHTPGNALPQVGPLPPAFTCHVYLTTLPDGQLRADVANLAGITVTAGSERSALQQTVAVFKAQLAKHLAAGEAIPWRTPPEKPAGAVERFLPMHM